MAANLLPFENPAGLKTALQQEQEPLLFRAGAGSIAGSAVEVMRRSPPALCRVSTPLSSSSSLSYLSS